MGEMTAGLRAPPVQNSDMGTVAVPDAMLPTTMQVGPFTQDTPSKLPPEAASVPRGMDFADDPLHSISAGAAPELPAARHVEGSTQDMADSSRVPGTEWTVQDAPSQMATMPEAALPSSPAAAQNASVRQLTDVRDPVTSEIPVGIGRHFVPFHCSASIPVVPDFVTLPTATQSSDSVQLTAASVHEAEPENPTPVWLLQPAPSACPEPETPYESLVVASVCPAGSVMSPTSMQNPSAVHEMPCATCPSLGAV